MCLEIALPSSMSVMIVNISHHKITILFSMTSPVLVAIIITVTTVVKILESFMRVPKIGL